MRGLFALLALFLLAAAAPPARDWRTHVTESEEGWTFGRPQAPLLVEYASFGCPHCGDFSDKAGPAIAERVKAGTLRFAFRPFLIFPHDRAATVLARCVPAPRRLAFVKAVMAAQGESKAKLAEADRSDATRQSLFEAELKGPEAQALLLADLAGLLPLAATHGLSDAEARACLASPDQHRWVTDADLAGRVAGVTGTPTYRWKGSTLPRGLTPEELVALLPR